ncbi:MAG: hypothetical protein PF518_00645 [Spirochaetaceae bacterium]|jgi:putative aldouronate transport system substrate-binding protein|nr:hypothetical protein [Spirochaetaceae bacterium]
MQTDRAAFDKQHGAAETFWMLMDNAMIKQWEPALVTPFKEMEEWSYPYTVSYAQFDNIDPTPDMDEGVKLGKIKALRGKYIPQLLTAKTESDFEVIWSEWQQKKTDLDYAGVIEYQTEKKKINTTKLGL